MSHSRGFRSPFALCVYLAFACLRFFDIWSSANFASRFYMYRFFAGEGQMLWFLVSNIHLTSLSTDFGSPAAHVCWEYVLQKPRTNMLSSSHFCFYQSQLTLTAAHDNMFRNSYAARYRSDTPIRPWLFALPLPSGHNIPPRPANVNSKCARFTNLSNITKI